MIARQWPVAAVVGEISSPVVRAYFHRLPHDRTVAVESPPAPQYEAGGPQALVDGLRGPENWRILVLWPPFPDAPLGVRDYSELVVAGDVFVWTNWTEDGSGVRRRVMYAVSKLARR